MGRAPCCEKNGLKKGPWTPEEDQKLIDYIQKHGYGNWRTLPKNAGLQRCGKSCRLRWTNYLRPDIKRGRFSFEEEETIIQLHSILGNKWSAIAARLPGRTDNEIKNYWNTHIRKRLLRMGIDPVTHSPRLDLLDLSSIFNSSLYNTINTSTGFLGSQNHPLVNPEILKLATSLLSSQQQQQQNTHSVLMQQQNQQVPVLQNNSQNQNQFRNHVPELVQTSSQQLHAPIPTMTTSTTMSMVNSTPCFPFTSSSDDQAQLLDPTSLDQYHTVNNSNDFDAQDFGAGIHCATSTTTQLNQLWHGQNNSSLASDFIQDYIPQQTDYSAYYPSGSDQTNILDPSSDNSTFYSSSQHNFSLASVLSTPSSSPTHMNSNSTSSTYINGCSTTNTTEDESYCSSLLKFEMPDILDVSDFM